MGRPKATNPFIPTNLLGIPKGEAPTYLKRKLGWMPNKAKGGNTKRQRKKK